MKIQNYIKIISTTLTLSALPLTKTPIFAQVKDSVDTFEYSIPPEGTTRNDILLMAPNPEITINGEDKTAKIVVDLSTNTLYKYNAEGKAESAYLIASGKPGTPTDKGIRIVTHVETYPYKSAPSGTRRRRKPNDYGPRALILEKLDPETGNRSKTGEFIHGNNNPGSIGKYVSLGCMRMDNEVIKKLAKEVKRGDIVIIK